MSRIIFLAPFAKSEISGGIKTVYRHAEMLAELGFDASVHQPEGPPAWFETRAKVLPTLAPEAGDVLVFPETLNGPLGEWAQRPIPARKVLFCQNQYYMALNPIPADRLAGLGFSHFAASSCAARDFMRSVLHIEGAALIPYSVDPAIFAARPKAIQIALVPRKMPREASLIGHIFREKYPKLQHVPWQVIDNAPERAAADILGRSAILLSLSFLESFGLVPVEAMAAGCIIIGFDGYGGREYASPENGFWFAPDQLEEVADALATAITGLESGDKKLEAMRNAGTATAARYSMDNTRGALREFYGRLT